MKHIYNSDKPIILEEQDRFNRFKFSARIAETIINRNNDEGLVIGLYGVWGEGKTSVLNMIEGNLQENDNVLIVKFNPWRFTDEDNLILNFFKNLSEVLNKELHTRKERFGDFLKKYGAATSVLNLNFEKIGEILSDTELEELKNRINDFLKESLKKVVVIIDDIDRLDKQELFSLFKLIKLTGDFSTTYYILAFDDEMVASAIGDRFADGDATSGYNFLEKIIQVPLRIPQARSKDLLNYTFKLLNKVFEENEVDLGTNEGQYLGSLISQNILLKIKTPRLAIRYANSLAFLIPLLKGEVNMSDLILFEAVKIFFPQYYLFIKSNPEYFIESYYEDYSYSKDNEKEVDFKNKIDELSKTISKNEKKALLNLIKHLFPITKEALENYHHRNGNPDWVKDKRIVSPKYFNRYFIYSVPNDDISDVFFDEYINLLSAKPFKEVLEETQQILLNVEPMEYLNKIGLHEDSLDWASRQVIIKLICNSQHKFEGMKGGTFGFSFHNPKSQAGITIARILLKHNNYSEKLEFSKFLMTEEVPFEFSEEIIRWLKAGKTEEDKVIKPSDLYLLNDILLDRAVKDCTKKEANLFETYEGFIFSLLKIWYDRNPEELKSYFDGLIEANPCFTETIIYSLTSTIYSSSHPEPYKTDFTKESFDLLKLYYNVEKLFAILMKQYSAELEKEEVKFLDNDKGQTILNAMRQFCHWYQRDKL